MCQKNLRTNPNKIEILIQYSFALFINKDYQAAAKMSQNALKVDPGNTTALAFLSSALNEIGDRKQAAYFLDFDSLIKTTLMDTKEWHKSTAEFNKALVEAVYEHPTLSEQKSNRSLSNGQCTSNLFDGNETLSLIQLKDQILATYENYKIEHPIQPNHPFLFQHPDQISIYCWANVMDDGGFHDTHFHPTAWLSGVYYPQLPKEVAKPNQKSKEGFLEFGRSYYRLMSSDSPPVFLVQPREGLMVLSPSYFGHRTIPFKSKQTRISIAFDIIPKSFVNRNEPN